ncbi:MAG: triosephosphate isomerase, partial [Blastocatellia bacterium]|nr:triosephosphate isomerase [Blastocatellia bacterium]
MFKLIGEAVAMVTSLKPLVENAKHCEIVVAPPYTALAAVADRLEGSNIRVAAQDLSSETKQGARTGEVCGEMLKDAGCTHVIIGHSERRSFCGETDEIVNRKIKAALSFQLIPIVCIGETLAERDGGEAVEVVSQQLARGLAELAT